MATNTKTAEKRTAVDYLNFGEKTAKRVEWEAFEFTIVGPHLVEVTNASYGFLKDDHSYTVGVEMRDGRAVPAECDCPADQYNEQYHCKHQVSLAVVGGEPVLTASTQYEPSSTTPLTESETLADKLANSDDCDCRHLSDNFPCWPCVRDGRRELPGDGK
jgi:hypothetical protein